jgi:hypothetical protein
VDKRTSIVAKSVEIGEVHTGTWLGKLEGRRPLLRPRRRWDDDIKMDLKIKMSKHGLDRSGSGQGHVAGACEGDN